MHAILTLLKLEMIIYLLHNWSLLELEIIIEFSNWYVCYSDSSCAFIISRMDVVRYSEESLRKEFDCWGQCDLKFENIREAQRLVCIF